MKIIVEVISPDARVAKAAAKVIKARVSPEGFMGSASRTHKPKKGKGSFRRRLKHQ